MLSGVLTQKIPVVFVKSDGYGRRLLIAHFGIPGVCGELLDEVVLELSRSLAIAFQGVTVARTEGFWVPEGEWSSGRERFGPEVERSDAVTVLLSTLPHEQERARAELVRTLSEATAHLGDRRPKHVHMEVVVSEAHHLTIP